MISRYEDERPIGDCAGCGQPIMEGEDFHETNAHVGKPEYWHPECDRASQLEVEESRF